MPAVIISNGTAKNDGNQDCATGVYYHPHAGRDKQYNSKAVLIK
jgi:hypothetical protein